MKKVLIVDDSLISRRMIRQLLSNYNLEIEEAKNGTDALGKIQSTLFDIIFLDLLMPDINGLEILEKIKTDNLQTKVIVISADIQETTKAKCFELGAFSFLNKPPKEDELRNILQKLI
ncbi:MAG: response regulator [Ignavibacteria bacterium]|nr:response regulator [Ignavibacteria bacterium]